MSQCHWHCKAYALIRKIIILFLMRNSIIFQLLNAFNSRELSHQSIFANITKNKLMLLVFGITFLFQIVITQFGGTVYNTVPLSINMWLKMIGLGSTVII